MAKASGRTKTRGAKAPNPTEAARELARHGLASFATLVYRRFELTAHLRMVIRQLERIERGEIDRLMLFLPPRHGKSLITSQIFPAWYLGRHPDRSVIASSYGQELASDFGRKVRNTMAEQLFESVFPQARISPDSTAAHRFATLSGGNYFAVGAGGPITGRGADLLLIYDPIKSAEQAYSASERKSLQSWFEHVGYTRLQPGGAIVLIQTRWHQDDLAGWLLREHANDGWEVVSLPAIAERDEGWRGEGTALWPKRFSLTRLSQIRAAIGGSAWASLYQQRPAAAEGAIFKRHWWRYWNAPMLPPRFEQVLISLDTAFKSGAANDYSAAVVLGVANNGFFILDVWRDRVEFPALERMVVALAERWRPERILIEDKASGMSLLQALRLNSRLPLTPIRIDADKVSRAHSCSPSVEAGNVLLPEAAPWLADFLDEVSTFPAGAHDDQVDALSQVLNFVRAEGGEHGIASFYRGMAERQARGEPEPEPDNEMWDVYQREMVRLAEAEDKARGVIYIPNVSSGSAPERAGAQAVGQLAWRSLFNR